MKILFYLSCFALLFSCSTQQKENSIIPVVLPTEGNDFISWFEIFPDMEMICLTGENRPMFGLHANLIVKDGVYYVVDQNQTRQIHRFKQDGSYLNSIGTFGRGPQEYLDMTDVSVDEKGNVSVYSQGAGTLLIYAPDGTFLERKEPVYTTERFIAHKGLNYHYIGTAAKDKKMDYRLYITDQTGQKIGEFLPTPTVPALPNVQTFSQNGNTLYLCPSEGNEIYELKKDKIETKYHFDFGRYALPDDYYQCASLQDLGEFIKDKTVIYKLAFQENENCAILEGVRQTGFTSFNPFCGILDRQKGVWKWFNFKLDSFIFFRYLDNQYAYFLADPEMIKQIPGLADRFPSLNVLSINDGMVILKAKTNKIDL